MIAKGEFLAEVIGAALTTSQTKGTEQIAVQFRFLEGPNEGSTITEYLALTDAALPYTVEKLRKCGWASNDVTELDAVAGRKVRLVLVHEEYQGKTRARVKFINEAREVKRLAADEAAGIASKWKSKIAALAAATGNGAASEPPPPNDEDRIPF